MTETVRILYDYVLECRNEMMKDPDYRASGEIVDKNYNQLKGRLNEEGCQLLDQLMDSLTHQLCLDMEYKFQIALEMGRGVVYSPQSPADALLPNSGGEIVFRRFGPTDQAVEPSSHSRTSAERSRPLY